MGDQDSPSSEPVNVMNSASPERSASVPPERASTPDPNEEKEGTREDVTERLEEEKPIQQQKQQQQKSEVTFLRGEQIPYLYEILRGKDVEPPASNFISCSDPVCDEYIDFVARTGRPLFEWSILKSLLLSKLESILWDMSQAGPYDHLPSVPNTDRSSSRQYIERILSACRSLTGVPFTIQRICELLTQPKKHYKRADKFYRALEKNITVVTTVDGEGRRETERQPEPPEEAIIPENSANSLTPEKSPYNHTPQ